MEGPITMEPIAHIRTQFPDKFGIPRQSGMVDALRATVVFEPPYRIGAYRGHICHTALGAAHARTDSAAHAAAATHAAARNAEYGRGSACQGGG